MTAIAGFHSVAAQEPCTRTGNTAGGALAGTVTDRFGTPLFGSNVIARWMTWVYENGALVERPRSLIAHTDAKGHYRLCALPSRVHLAIEARYGRTASHRVVLLLRDAVEVPFDLAVTGGNPPAGDAGTVMRLGSLTGVVTDSSGIPLAGARVSMGGIDLAMTDDSGTFDLGSLFPGTYTLRARRLGYRSRTAVVSIMPEVRAAAEFRLAAVPVELTGVVTLGTPNEFELSTGFGERRRRGPGVFFDRNDIERRKPHLLTDLLRSVAGFRVERRLTRWGYQTTALMERASSGSVGCPIDYYVNGHEYTPTSMGIDSDVPASQIEAIEVYKPSQTPPQFLGMHSRCGAVVIWTRYRAHELDG